MKCQEVIERIDDHVDGLLPVPESEAIRNHLDVCVECRENALALRAATASLSTWNDIEPPATCFDEILARIGSMPVEQSALAVRHAVKPAAIAAPARLVNRIARFQDVEGPHVRRFATTGLAAAAVVLGALLVSQSEPRTTRKQRDFHTSANQMVTGGLMSGPAFVPAVSVPMFQDGYDLDDGLFRYDANPSRPVRAARSSPVGERKYR